MFSQNGVVRGRVFNEINNEPLEFASVLVEGTPRGAYTDSTGAYEIKGIEPGLYNVKVTYTGYGELVEFEVEVFNNKVANVDFGMKEEGVEANTVEITASPFSKTEESPVSLRTIGVNEIQRNPGGNRDISKALQSLPGVASTVGFRNDIIIRGGSPSENSFYLDGIEVPTINHFTTQGASGGPVGMINVNFIREVDFYSGAFPANRGGALSSVMNFKMRDGRDDRLGANFTLGSSDVGLTLEGPMGKKSTFMLSARRSYLQFLFKALALPFLPNYNDFQYKQKVQLGDKDQITFIGLGAIDDFALNLEADSTDFQKYILGNLPVNTQWNYTVGANYKHFREKGYYTVVASRNMLNNRAVKYQNNDDSDEGNKVLDYTSQEIENKLRIENTIRDNGWKINYGVAYQFAKYTNSTFNQVSLPAFPDSLITIDFESNLLMHKYGLFGQVSKTMLDDRLILSAGLRTDGNNFSSHMANPINQLAPRLSASYVLAPKWTVNFNTGIYYDLPQYTVLGYRDGDGNLVNKDNDLKYIRVKHLVGGFEWNYSNSGKITLEGFYKDYDQYPFLINDSISLANLGGNFGVIGNEPVSSISEGRAYGAEFLFQQKLYKGFYGILAYTWVRSEFADKNGEFLPAAWDNGHILTFTGGKKSLVKVEEGDKGLKRFFKSIAENAEVGAKWRFQGGSPYTPFDVQRSSLIPVWNVTGQGLLDYNQLNSQRLGPAHFLDFRVDKRWYFEKWSLNCYFDLQNAYGFAAPAPDYLDVVRDQNDMPIVDPNDPSRYLTNLIENSSGTVLPSVGIVIEL